MKILLSSIVGVAVIAGLGAAAWFFVVPFYSSKDTVIPVSCISNAVFGRSILPPDSNIAGHGRGTLLASDDAFALIVQEQGAAGSSFASRAYLVRKSDGAVIRELQFDNDILSAAFRNGALYLFNIKTPYIMDEKSGKGIQQIFETDNYRGIHSTDGTRYLQRDVTMAALRSDGSLILPTTIDLKTMAFGCLLSDF